MNRALLIVAVVGMITLAGCGSGLDVGTDTEEQDDVDGELEIHHIDAGQADSTLLITPDGETILVDTGDWRPDGQDVIDYLEAHDVDRVDHLVATHAHADHIGGHAAVIEHFEENGEGIGAAYDSGVAHTSQTYDDYLDAIEAHDVDLFEVVEGDELPLEDDPVEATVLNPPEDDSGTALHYNSVSLAIEFGEFSYLTTGDAEEDVEQRLLEEADEQVSSTAYQAGHHGSSTSSTPPFLDAVDPEVAIVSSALDSQYGHPHDEILESFADRDIETYWTGVHGDVLLTTDGENVSVTTEEEAPTDAAELLERKHEHEDEQEHDATEQSSVDQSVLDRAPLQQPAADRPGIDSAPAHTLA